MEDKNLISAIDIGTTKICTLIAAPSDSSIPDIIGVGIHASDGLKKGSVVNIEKTVQAIRQSVKEAELMAGVKISGAVIGISGNHIYSFNSSGVVAVKGTEITEEDVARVLEAAKAVMMPADREIIHVIPQEFKVDSVGEIKNPVGMCGVRLEVKVHIVTGTTMLIQNLLKCVENAGLRLDGIILRPLASSGAVLTNEEKEIGVILADIGGGTTDLAVWREGSIVHTQTIPIGGNNFTNDLAVALKVSHAEAENIKLEYGSVLAEKVNSVSHITVKGLPGSKPREISVSFIASILEARAEELFNLIKDVLVDRGLRDIPGGVVLTGGTSQLQAMSELGEFILERPTKVGYPLSAGGMANLMQNPQFATVLGLLLEIQTRGLQKNNKTKKVKTPDKKHGDFLGKLSDSLRSVFNELF